MDEYINKLTLLTKYTILQFKYAMLQDEIKGKMGSRHQLNQLVKTVELEKIIKIKDDNIKLLQDKIKELKKETERLSLWKSTK